MKILIGVTGSVAAVKTIDLTHKIVQAGHECKVIITQDGLNFVTPMALASRGADVFIDNKIDSYKYQDIMEHINLAKWADYIIIVPASANTIAKLAHGFADNLLTATVLASPMQKIIVPAMNKEMWGANAVAKNIEKLNELGFLLWGPTYGLQACGDIGVGRMLNVDEIIEKISLLEEKKGTLNWLKGKKVVITAGGTIEYLDPVRYITNKSSGKMGYALAQYAIDCGADVILISARVDVEKPQGLKALYSVNTAEEMLQTADREACDADIFVGCAAVCDYKAAAVKSQKINEKSETLNLKLVKNPDIIATIKKKYPSVYTVGFAAETEHVIDHAMYKLKLKNLDLIVANDVAKGVFGSDYNQVTIIDRDLNKLELAILTKSAVAKEIFAKIAQVLG